MGVCLFLRIQKVISMVWVYSVIPGMAQWAEIPNKSDIAYYLLSGTHSAIYIEENKFVSKWGQGPVMQHALNDCPYDWSQVRYYHR
jgi:hypothetical protein